MKKITKATMKSFIKKNKGNLYIKHLSHFNGMVDCVENIKDSGFDPVVHLDPTAFNFDYRLGIQRAYFVGKDSYSNYQDNNFTGIKIYNCCGSFIVAIPNN